MLSNRMLDHTKNVSKNLFSDANVMLSKFYKDALFQKEQAYRQGKEDAICEVIKLLQSHKQGRDLKHVPIS